MSSTELGPLSQAIARRPWAVPLIGGLLGGLAMTFCLGPSLVDPTNVEWLMHGDYALHFLGWHHYRNGPWTLPLGAAPLLIWPIGSSVGLTDAIPVAAVPLKALDPLLPPVFQFIGLWLVSCFALQGVFGVLLMRLVTPRPSLQLLGASLLILSPPLIYRIVHAALTTHWLLLGALWLNLKDEQGVPSTKLAAGWIALVAITAATQPYVLLMVLVLMAAAHARQVLAAPSQVVRIGLYFAVAVAAGAVSLWQSGSFMVRTDDGLEIGGFGAWSTNLLSLIMPTEASTLLAPGPFAYARVEQYEGYAYLGAGLLLAGAVVLVTRVRSVRSLRWPRRVSRHVPLALALAFLAAMALGPAITLGARTLFAYDVAWWGPLRIFRTNGRMIWPVYYAVVIAILFGVSRFSTRRAAALLSVALIAQVVDLAGMARYVRDVGTYGFRDPLESRFWRVVPQHYQRLVLIPTNLCAREGSIDHLPFALLAGTNGLAINAGMTSRYDAVAALAYCKELSEEIRGGLASDQSLYIVRPDLLPDITTQTSDGSLCTVVDGYGVCFSRESHSRWRDSFDPLRSRLPPPAEVIRFYAELSDVYRTTLGRPPREAPGATGTRLEAIVRYLAFRMEGCDHAEAETRAMDRTSTTPARTFCAALALRHEMPPADQTYAFSTRLADALRAVPGGAVSTTHVDPEGEAVWLQAYARERARGMREQDARAAVLEAVRAAAR